MNTIRQQLEIIDILVAAEKFKDNIQKASNKNLTGENSTIFYLKRLRELIVDMQKTSDAQESERQLHG